MTGRAPEDQMGLFSLEGDRIDRAELLKRGGVVLIGPTLLAAARAGSALAGGKIGGTIDFLSWEGYDLPKVMAPWKQAHGVGLKATYISKHDDIQAKIVALRGRKGYDVVTYYQGYKPLYKQLGIVTALDTSKIPNLKNLLPFFASSQHNWWVDPDGKRTGVPWTWGAEGINYDSAVVKDPPRSYFELLQPNWKGKVTFSDDPVGAYGQAAIAHGYDVARLTKPQFKTLTEFLKRMAAQTKGVASSYGDVATRLVSGDAVVAYTGWAAVNKFAADAGKKTVQTLIPKEGGFAFCDSWAIPPTADNADTVLAWINQTLDPKVNARAAVSLVAGVTVKGAWRFLDKPTFNLYPYPAVDRFLRTKVRFFTNPPVKSSKYATLAELVSTFDEVKASA